MNTHDKVQILQHDAAIMAKAIYSMNRRITQLEHLKQPLATRIWHNMTQLIINWLDKRRFT